MVQSVMAKPAGHPAGYTFAKNSSASRLNRSAASACGMCAQSSYTSAVPLGILSAISLAYPGSRSGSWEPAITSVGAVRLS